MSALYPHSLKRQIKVYHKDVKLEKSGGENRHKVSTHETVSIRHAVSGLPYMWGGDPKGGRGHPANWEGVLIQGLNSWEGVRAAQTEERKSQLERRNRHAVGEVMKPRLMFPGIRKQLGKSGVLRPLKISCGRSK